MFEEFPVGENPLGDETSKNQVVCCLEFTFKGLDLLQRFSMLSFGYKHCPKVVKIVVSSPKRRCFWRKQKEPFCWAEIFLNIAGYSEALGVLHFCAFARPVSKGMWGLLEVSGQVGSFEDAFCEEPVLVLRKTYNIQKWRSEMRDVVSVKPKWKTS